LSSDGSKTRGLLWLAAAALFTAAMVFGLPVIAKHTPWRVERWLAGVFGGTPAAAPCKGRTQAGSFEQFQRVVKRIYPLDAEDSALPITIDVIPGKTVNAYATLGGHIYVFDGLLQQAKSAEELAGVLAHEIEHVRNRHIMQGVAVNLLTFGAFAVALPGDPTAGSQIAYLLLSLKFSRQQEHEADEAGLQRLRTARVDAAGLQNFFTRAEKMAAPPQILSNHPANEARAELAARFRGYASEPVLTDAEWKTLVAICQ
jgi:predicted Zn-dependent protease